jgi:hypothetical protein
MDGWMEMDGIVLDPGVHGLDVVLCLLGLLPTTPRDSVEPSRHTKLADLPINCGLEDFQVLHDVRKFPFRVIKVQDGFSLIHFIPQPIVQFR